MAATVFAATKTLANAYTWHHSISVCLSGVRSQGTFIVAAALVCWACLSRDHLMLSRAYVPNNTLAPVLVSLNVNLPGSGS